MNAPRRLPSLPRYTAKDAAAARIALALLATKGMVPAAIPVTGKLSLLGSRAEVVLFDSEPISLRVEGGEGWEARWCDAYTALTDLWPRYEVESAMVLGLTGRMGAPVDLRE